MKIPKQFLSIYDRSFSFILDEYGLDALIKYWKHITPVVLRDLIQMARYNGIKGCYKYWDKTLKEEKAHFKLKLLKEGTELQLDITKCPSIEYLNSPQCREYCRHCGVIYPEALNQFGLKFELLRKGAGRCEIKVSQL